MRARALTAAAVWAVISTLIAAPGQATTNPGPYVALGDSYSAASGVLPLDPNAALQCARSTRNYPHLIAQRTGAPLVDVTCGAAQVKDFTENQWPNVAPQLNALRSTTKLVTLTIGGNDANLFIGAVAACGTAGIATWGFGSPCKTIYGNYFDNRVDTIVYPNVKRGLQQIHAAAPNARVAILGYPEILPATKGCFTKMPIATGDVPYVYNLQVHLNAAIKQAASETGTTWVDLAPSSRGHDACTPIGTRWVEPALWGTNFVPVHPNALGEAKMADAAMAVLGLN